MRTNIKNLLISILLTAAIMQPVRSGAQLLKASLSHYSTEDGLASNAVSDIEQDDYGYIWIATWNGLSRFDGFNFFNYPTGSRSGIPLLHNRIIEIKTDHSQNVWMRMYDGRIFVLNRSTDIIENALRNISGYQDFKTSSNLMLTSSGDIMAIIDGVGIYRMNLSRNRMKTTLTGTRGLKATALAEGYHGDIWVGTDRGIHRMSLSEETIDRRGIFENETITCMYSNGYNIYAGTASGKIVSFAYGQEPKELVAKSTAIRNIFVDSHNILWFATSKQGVSRMNTETGDVKDFAQRVLVPAYDANVANVSEVGHTVWASMTRGGFGYYNREADEIEYFHNDPSNTWNMSNTLSCYLALPEGVVWESTVQKGLDKLEILKNTIKRKYFFQLEPDINTNEIRAMCYDMKQRLLLVGNKQGTMHIFKDRNHIATLNDDGNGGNLGRIYGLYIDSKGRYWICSKGKGVTMVEPSGNNYRMTLYSHNPNDKMSLSSNDAYCATEDIYGNIWIATYNGGVNIVGKSGDGRTVFLNNRNVMRHYPHNAYGKVRTLAADNEGNVWAGTTDGLLVMSYRNNKINIQKVSETENGRQMLQSKDIVTLACDGKGMVWIGTNGGGLSHVTGRDADGNWLFETLSAENGLPSEEIKSITFDSKNNVWFATDNMICSFDTEKHIFSTFSMLDGVDNTICSEGAAVTMADNNIMFGTLDGCYVIDRDKLTNYNSSMLKLRITDFWIDGELMSPRLNSTYSYYVPESKSVTLPSNGSAFELRFASLNYQLQHRVHYQYMLEGYDKEWHNADKARTASYSGIGGGHYKFKVKAFLLESPDNYDMREIEIVVPPHFLLSTGAIWTYLVLAAILMLAALYVRQKRLAGNKHESYAASHKTDDGGMEE